MHSITCMKSNWTNKVVLFTIGLTCEFIFIQLDCHWTHVENVTKLCRPLSCFTDCKIDTNDTELNSRADELPWPSYKHVGVRILLSSLEMPWARERILPFLLYALLPKPGAGNFVFVCSADLGLFCRSCYNVAWDLVIPRCPSLEAVLNREISLSIPNHTIPWLGRIDAGVGAIQLSMTALPIYMLLPEPHIWFD